MLIIVLSLVAHQTLPTFYATAGIVLTIVAFRQRLDKVPQSQPKLPQSEPKRQGHLRAGWTCYGWVDSL